MAFARKTLVFLTGAFLILLPLQFLFAGFGVFSGDYDIHEAYGAGLLHLVVLLMVISALVAREWKFAGLAFAVFVVIFIQISLVEIGRDSSEWIAAFHPFLAFCYWPFVYFLIWLPLREPTAEAAA